MTGNIIFDGLPVSLADIRKQSAYVSQDDSLFSYLTVEETLLLSAHFNLPVGSAEEVLNEAVNESIRKFGLEKVRNTIVGSSTRRGISGGEKKRVAIAKELLSDPLILFMDEPTSNLDAFQALSVVECFRVLASTGKIIIAVVHQPRSSIYFLFDTLMLLAEGRVVYFGPINDCTKHFSEIGYLCPTNFNPADFIMDVVSTDSRTEELRRESENRIAFLSTQWLEREQSTMLTSKQHQKVKSTSSMTSSEQNNNNSNAYNQLQTISEDVTEEKDDGLEPLLQLAYTERHPSTATTTLSSSTSSLTAVDILRSVKDFKILTWRSCAQLFRNHFGVGVRVFTLIFFAAILSLIYQRLGYNQKNIQDRIGIIFFVTSNQVK